jgi:hypothetical protein
MGVIIFGVMQEPLYMAHFILQYYLASVFDKRPLFCQLKHSFLIKKWKKKKRTAVVQKVSLSALF